MKTNPSIFKAYDIRGIYNKDLNEETAFKLGLAYTKLLRKKYKKNKDLKIVVASDARISSPSLKKSLIMGLVKSGVKVVVIGVQATPTFYFSVANYNYDGGIIVSASHNPKEWNGFKLVRERSIPISEKTGINFLKKEIKNIKEDKNIKAGSVTKKSGVLKSHIKHDLKIANTTNIKKLKIVLDPANAVGALFLEELFKHIPAKLIKINFKLDGNFPAHEADPLKKENLEQIKKVLIKEKADLGITTDGDGDRIFFIDDKGELIDQSIIRGLLAQIFLKQKPGAKIGFDVRPGKITEDLIIKNGGRPVETRVGHSLIKEQMLKEDIFFSGESSGHFFLNMEIGCFEVPNIVILKLLEEFSREEKNISSQIKKYKKYFNSGEININVKDKEGVFKKIETKYKKGEIKKIDGLSIAYKDFWFNLRASNTENKIRLNIEATSKKILKEKEKEILKVIKLLTF
ncbi:MAG: phosphomannomutase/phosphoglucomutase [Patescibacteria group bacterium]